MTAIDDPLLRTPRQPRTEVPAHDRRPPPSKASASRVGQKWSRLVHVYASMVAFAVVLLFSFTGLMLNHPTWTLGDDPNTSMSTGALPIELYQDDGALDDLTLSEVARDRLGARGEVTSFGEAGGSASIVYADPGYTADLVVDVDTSTYRFTSEQQGWVAMLSDFHTGTDTGGAWSWAIDAAAIFLIAVSLSGIVLQFFLRKRRRSAYVSAGVGGVIVVVLIAAALR